MLNILFAAVIMCHTAYVRLLVASTFLVINTCLFLLIAALTLRLPPSPPTYVLLLGFISFSDALSASSL